MKDLILTMRLMDETINSTVSRLHYQDEFFGFILEDGHRDEKEYGHTRIPAGTYPLVKRQYGTFYGRYKQKYGHSFAIGLDNVPNTLHIAFNRTILKNHKVIFRIGSKIINTIK